MGRPKKYDNEEDRLLAIKESTKKAKKKYRQTENGIKKRRIDCWKFSGVISDDFDKLYERYINTEICDNCEIILICGNKAPNRKTLDHNHETGEFRNILCNTCNTRIH